MRILGVKNALNAPNLLNVMALPSHLKHAQTLTLAKAGQNTLMAATQHHVTIVPNVASLGKDKNFKCELWLLLNVYCFPNTIKSKIVS